MSVAVAVPFDPLNIEKLRDIVTKCCQHKSWFSDTDYSMGEPHLRTLVIARLSNIHSRSWEVYRDNEIVGLLHADDIVPKQDCNCHFIFYDRSLVDKRALCINTMDYLFTKYELHALRVQIPSYAAKLLGFIRKALGFRYEGEQRIFSWPASAAPISADAAKLGSRLHQAVLHEGVWHDLLLLSITADEFRAWMKAHTFDRPVDQATPVQRTVA